MNIFKIIVLVVIALLAVCADAATLAIHNATDSGHGHRNYPASNTIDASLHWSSRWAASGSPVNLKLDLGSIQKVTEVGISWGRGGERVFTFEIWARKVIGESWTKVYDDVSTGITSSIEVYNITDIDAQEVRIKTFSNSADTNWTDIKEVEIYGISTTKRESKKPVTLETINNELAIHSAFDDGTSHHNFPPSKVIDGSTDWSSRWAAENNSKAVNLTIQLDKTKNVTEVGIAWGQGDSRTHTFEIYARSGISGVWTKVYDNVSSGKSIGIEVYDISNLDAQQIRIKGQSNSTSSDWISITEVKIYGTEK